MICISPNQSEFRSLLTVFSFLFPKEVMENADPVNSLWHNIGSCEELWLNFYIKSFSGLPQCPKQIKSQFQTQINLRRSICVISKLSLRVIHIPTLATTEFLIEEVQRSRYAAWCTAYNGDVTVCGGVLLPEKRYLASVYQISYGDRSANRISDMITARAGGGIIVSNGNLYIFGGDNPNNLTACEVLSGRTWRPLPEMFTPRRSFTPAVHQLRVYLAGGGGSMRIIEVFHILKEEFDVLPIPLPFLDSLSLAVVMGTDLLILLRHKMLLWPFDSNSPLQTISTIPNQYWYSPQVPSAPQTTSTLPLITTADCTKSTLRRRPFLSSFNCLSL